MNPIKISYFSDILCVWAYISQIRIEKLQHAFAKQIELQPNFFHVFGFATEKLQHNWLQKGGIDAYAEHIREVASNYPHIELNPKVWSNIQPKSSMPAHLYLCAIRYLEKLQQIEGGSFFAAIKETRLRFFRDAEDISSTQILDSIVKSLLLPISEINNAINSGAAHAELSKDVLLAEQLNVTVSPTLIFNQGRQKLAGNVGYRVIEANIKELIKFPEQQASWC